MRGQGSTRSWVVAFFLFAAACTGAAHPLEDDQPAADLYVVVGSAVSVRCEAGTGAEWRRNGTEPPLGVVLKLDNVSLEDGGLYTCHTAGGDLRRKLSLQPGYPPSPPKVHCWSPNYPLSVMCSWNEEPEPILPTNYTATYSLENSADVRPCHSTTGQSRVCLLRGAELFSIKPHILNVTAINPLGSSTRLLPFVLEDIVKPDPPMEVRAVPVMTKQLVVEWSPPASWSTLVHFPLKYRVRYRLDGEDISRTLGPYESTRMVLKGLRPGKTYHVQVSAQELLDLGQSSDWSAPVSATVSPQ
ncbi:interleukin-27 subunit beta [Scleropages formosus]|nr:interleukin-27 subunit beta [Scleropages formosus]